jgi:hypothetical protein
MSTGEKRGRGVMLTTHPHLVPRSRMSRSYTSSPPQAPPWRVTGLLCFFGFFVLPPYLYNTLIFAVSLFHVQCCTVTCALGDGSSARNVQLPPTTSQLNRMPLPFMLQSVCVHAVYPFRYFVFIVNYFTFEEHQCRPKPCVVSAS